MKQCLIVYYSQSGTTANIAKSIASGLNDNNCRTTLVNIYNEKPPEVLSYDLIGIGAPVYFFHPVSEIRRYITRLPDLEHKPFFIFMAYGTNPGKSIDLLKKALINKSGEYLGAITCQNSNFIMGVKKAGMSLDQINEQDLAAARKFGAALKI